MKDRNFLRGMLISVVLAYILITLAIILWKVR